MWTARILQFPFDPAQRLLREGLNIASIPVAEQLHQSCTEQLSSPSVPVALQAMPLALINLQQAMQSLTAGQCLIRPIASRGTHGVPTTHA